MPVKTRPDQSLRALAAGLEARREEIGEAVAARVFAIEGARQGDPEYTDGLRQAIEAGIDYSLEAATEGDDERSPIPSPLLTQARLAARHRVALETVLRRYLAGHALLGDFIAEQAAHQAISPEVLRGVLREQASRTDRVVAQISSAYAEEASAARPRSSDRRRTEQVRRLLEGELVDPAGLGYELEGWHVGLIVHGYSCRDVAEALARRLDARRLIAAAVEEEAHWLWLGFRERPDSEQLREIVPSDLPAGLRVGIGEPGEGHAGWRLTHEQARAALSVAVRRPEVALRYKDVALLASAIHDALLTTSLTRLYLEPLEDHKESGQLRTTLRAYFEADRSVTSTAAALGVNRNTVANRIRNVEERIGYLHPTRAAHLLVALGLSDLSRGRQQTA